MSVSGLDPQALDRARDILAMTDCPGRHCDDLCHSGLPSAEGFAGRRDNVTMNIASSYWKICDAFTGTRC